MWHQINPSRRMSAFSGVCFEGQPFSIILNTTLSDGRSREQAAERWAFVISLQPIGQQLIIRKDILDVFAVDRPASDPLGTTF